MSVAADRAEDIIRSITDEYKAGALIRVAQKVAATDPDRAARLTAGAEGIAQSISSEYLKVLALARIAAAVAATDPDRTALLTDDAERIAQSITDRYTKALALARVAEAVTVAMKPMRNSQDRRSSAASPPT